MWRAKMEDPENNQHCHGKKRDTKTPNTQQQASGSRSASNPRPLAHQTNEMYVCKSAMATRRKDSPPTTAKESWMQDAVVISGIEKLLSSLTEDKIKGRLQYLYGKFGKILGIIYPHNRNKDEALIVYDNTQGIDDLVEITRIYQTRRYNENVKEHPQSHPEYSDNQKESASGNYKEVDKAQDELPKDFQSKTKSSTSNEDTTSFSKLHQTSGYVKDPRQSNTEHLKASKMSSEFVTMNSATIPTAKPKPESNDTCPICMDYFTCKTSLEKCKHSFCKECIDQATKSKSVCPICQTVYGKLEGDQPKDASMKVKTYYRTPLPGYEKYGTIIIYYDVPSGRQGPEHPHPGRPYNGTTRTAYLPDSLEGRHVLGLLRRAFDQRLIFTIGTSSTTGLQECVTWNNIQHKTSAHGGPDSYGYPDRDYLKRVQEQLKAKGIF